METGMYHHLADVIENWGKALKVSEFAELMNCSEGVIYDMVNKGQIPWFRCGGIKFEPATTAKWLRDSIG